MRKVTFSACSHLSNHGFPWPTRIADMASSCSLCRHVGSRFAGRVYGAHWCFSTAPGGANGASQAVHNASTSMQAEFYASCFQHCIHWRRILSLCSVADAMAVAMFWRLACLAVGAGLLFGVLPQQEVGCDGAQQPLDLADRRIYGCATSLV